MAVAATRKKIMDKKKKIELEVLNISNSQEQAGAYALVLVQDAKDGIRDDQYLGISDTQIAFWTSLIMREKWTVPVNYRLSSVRQKHKRC